LNQDSVKNEDLGVKLFVVQKKWFNGCYSVLPKMIFNEKLIFKKPTNDHTFK